MDNQSNNNDNDINEKSIVNGYFSSIKLAQERYHNLNVKNEMNVNMSLIKKDFVTTLISPQIQTKAINISKDWYQYFYYYLYRQSDKNVPWAYELIRDLENEFFFSENKYQSMFFFEEFQIKTKPAILKQADKYIQVMNNDSQLNDILEIPFEQLCSSKHYGGSFVSTTSHSLALFPEDLQSLYMHSRSRVKEYIDIFCQHVQYKDHPINIIANVFCKAFSFYVNNEIKELKKLNNELSSKYKETLFNKSLSITKQLQKFIIKLQIVFKLFYCQTIDYQCFTEEKDELVTCITSILFQENSLYQSIYDLYQLSEEAIMISLSDKFNALKNIQPEDLRIDPKYCLNNSTLIYQKEFLKKQSNLAKNEDNNDIKLIKTIDEKIERGISYVPSNNTNDLISYQLNLVDNSATIKVEQFIHFDNENITIDNINDKTQLTETHIQIDSKRKDKTVNAKMHKFKIEEDNKISGFKSAINMLEAIKQHHTPFEKMVIITKIGEKIAESVNLFWKDLNTYLSPGYLTIDADNLLSIFIYVLIKSKMCEIAIHSRIIKQFTTTTTKLSSIGYYYSTLDASVNYIDETDKTELISKIGKDAI